MVDQSYRNLHLTVSCINVNTMNVSTLGGRNAKTYLKIEGVTGKRSDIIFMSDMRVGGKKKEIEDIFRMTKNGNYVTYINSSRNARGVGIAIKKNIAHSILNRSYDEIDENYILLELDIKGRRLLLGSVYGPNENNPDFYNRLKREIDRYGIPTIIGGDFNTILDQEGTDENLDRIGEGRVPNRQNSNILNKWIRDGNMVDPYRALYPETREISYVSYRGGAGGGARVGEITGKTRLDFFLISATLLGIIDTVKYADRLSADFDHKEVLMNIGRKPPVGRITIYDSTLNDKVSESIGIYAIYEAIANHLENRDNELDRWLTQLDILIRNVELLTVLRDSGWEDEESRIRYLECFTNINVIITRIRSRNYIEQNFGEYSYRQLYEVVTIGIKN